MKIDHHHIVFCTRLYDYIEGHKENPTTVGEHLNHLSEIEEIIDEYNLLIEECESPIEKQLGAALLFAVDGYNRVRYGFDADNTPAGFDTYGTCLCSQAEIAGYRADFLLVTYAYGHIKRLVIECDGHDFHEKTKQQASRDKKRDRAFTAAGIPVYRFSGSDIYSRLDECLEEIEAYLSRNADDCLIKAGKISAPIRRANG